MSLDDVDLQNLLLDRVADAKSRGRVKPADELEDEIAGAMQDFG